jgi:thiamine-phosphate pyrophosphorylase
LQAAESIAPVRAQKGTAMKLDLRLNAIVDPEHCGGRVLGELARLCAEGGATLVQLRDKHGETRRMVEEARAVQKALAPFQVPLVVNDRVDVALAAGAEGVHLGQDDMAVGDARRILGPAAVIGLSVKTMEEAMAAPIELIDYVGVGGVYATLSKQQKIAPIGPDGLARIAEELRRRAQKAQKNLLICGIAGINAENAGAVVAAGADGVAVISALSLVPDPAAAARELRQSVDAMLAKRGT